MKNIIYLFLILNLFSCNKKEEKPVVSISQFSRQVVVMNGVVNKILNEQDPKKMYHMADAIESSRAVDCIPVGEECNSYYKLINKVVNYTKEGSITNDQRMELFKLQNQFNSDVKVSENKLKEMWKSQLNTEKSP